MNLPRSDSAHVPPEKLSGYLLSDSHPVGRSKARFLASLGYERADQVRLAEQLLEIARNEEVTREIRTEFGTKYVVEGRISTPSGGEARLRTVWIVEEQDTRPRFVTAYPLT